MPPGSDVPAVLCRVGRERARPATGRNRSVKNFLSLVAASAIGSAITIWLIVAIACFIERPIRKIFGAGHNFLKGIDV